MQTVSARELGVHPGYPESVGLNTYIEREYEPFIHDLTVKNVTASDHSIYQGQLVKIFVIAENLGNTTETFSVVSYYNNYTIGTKIVENLVSGANISLTFYWNTTEVQPCEWYRIKAETLPVTYEENILNNVLAGDTVHIKMHGDINGDHKIDIKDIAIVSIAYGSYPSHPKWNPHADITGPEYLVPDSKVDIREIALVAIHYGEVYP